MQPAIDRRRGPVGEEKVPARCPSENGSARRRGLGVTGVQTFCLFQRSRPTLSHSLSGPNRVCARDVDRSSPSVLCACIVYDVLLYCCMFDCIILRQRLGFSFLFPFHSFSFSLFTFLHTNVDVCHEVGGLSYRLYLYSKFYLYLL